MFYSTVPIHHTWKCQAIDKLVVEIWEVVPIIRSKLKIVCAQSAKPCILGKEHCVLEAADVDLCMVSIFALVLEAVVPASFVSM